ncbi:MAG: helix-turn-helix domain-containing protein [Clostridiaceae bacterium]|nr:helix-turn-helix domain-containing protein [Clostridiaceae bacterium]
MQYMTIPEAARLWRISPQNIRTACEDRKIQGAVRFGRSWLIPQSAQLHLEEGKISAVLSASERWYQQRLVESQSEWQQFIEIH